MKSLFTYTFILSLLFLSIPLQVFSQKKLVSTHTESFSNGTFSPYDSIIYQYDANGRQISWQSKYYDQNSSTWKNLLSYEYTYNSNGKISTAFVKIWANNEWKDNSLNTYIYNNSNHLKTLGTSRWYNNQWNTGPKTEYYYSSNNTLPDSTIYFNYTNNNYSKSTKNIFSYNLDDKISLDIDLYWEKITNSWIQNIRKTYFYNLEGLNSEIITAEKAQIGWNTINTQEITYDSDGDIRQTISKDGNGNTTRRTTYIYDSPATGLSKVNSFKSSVYPNPASDKCLFNWEGQSTYSLKITDSKGRVVRAFENIPTSTLDFDLTTLSSGVYYYEIEDNSTKKVSLGKLMIE